ncbi:MAG: zinc ribbon domain-containing protein [Leisingera sp.]
MRARLAKQSNAKNIGKSTRKPARPFSGLLKCSCCGGGMSIHDRKGNAIRLRCSTAKESGTCSNTGKVRLDKIEDVLFENLRAELENPSYIDAFIREYNAESRRLSSGDQVDSKKLEPELKEAETLFRRRISLFEKGILEGEEGEAQLHEAKGRVAAAKEELKALEQQAEELKFDPASAATYAAALDGLFLSMRSDGGGANVQARDAMRNLVEEIIVSPAEKDGVPVEVKGRLSSFVLGGLAQRSSNRSEKVGGLVVAEEGLEPPTRGL